MAVSLGSYRGVPVATFALIISCCSLFYLVLGCAYAVLRVISYVVARTSASSPTPAEQQLLKQQFAPEVKHVFAFHIGHQASTESGSSAMVCLSPGIGIFVLMHLVGALLCGHLFSRSLKRSKRVMDYLLTIYGSYLVLCMAISMSILPSVGFVLAFGTGFGVCYLRTTALTIQEETRELVLGG